MDGELLLVTKLAEPATSRWHLERAHLAETLEAGRFRRLTALIAAAGHGKTTTLAHFLGRSGIPCLWIQLDPGDSEIGTFCRYLSFGIRSRLGGGERLGLKLRSPGTSLLPAQLLPPTVQDLMNCPPCALVLDDFHLVDRQSPVVQLVSDLLAYGPPHVHLYVCSRTPLPFSTARLKVNQQAAEITEEDLKFTPGEIHTYFSTVANIALDDAALEQVAHLTEGWSAALVLLAAALKRRGSLDTFLRGAIPADLFSYLADEVLSGLAPEVQAFLEDTSVLDACTPAACEVVSGRPDAAAVLAGLTGSHMLITELGPGQYRYHHLFQRFLQERLKLRDGGATHSALNRRAGDWYMAQRQPEEAVRHYLRGNCLAEAARLVEDLAPLWLRTNRLDRLRGMLALLPNEAKEQYPWISLCEARQLINEGNLEAATGMVKLALRAFAGRGEDRGLVQAYTMTGEVFSMRQQYEEALAAFAQATSHLHQEFRDEEASLLERQAAVLFITQGAEPRVEEDLRRSLSLYVELGDITGEAKVSDVLGAVRGCLGDYPSAVRLLERSSELLKRLGEPHYEVGVNLSHFYMRLGRFRDALALLEPILTSSSRKIRRAYAANNLLTAYTRTGEFTRAAAVAQSGHALVEELGHRELKANLAAGLSGLYRLSGQGATAIAYAQEAMATAKEIDRNNFYLQQAFEAVQLHLFQTGNAAGARRMAEKALSRLDESDPWERMMFTLSAAVAAFRLARTESRPEAVRLLQDGLAESRRRGYQVFALHEWPLALTVSVYGLAYGVLPDFSLELLQLMDERLPANVKSPGIPLQELEAKLIPAAWQALPDDAARAVFGRLLVPADRRRVVSLATGPAPLRIQTLGPLALAVGGRPVDTKALKRRKSGQLLALLLAGEGPAPRDRVLDQLWPDLDADAADTSLRVTIHYLRRLLEPHLGGRGRSRYIHAEGGVVWFSRQAEVAVDLDSFRHAFTQAVEAAGAGDDRSAVAYYENAARVYRGDFCADEPYSGALEEVRAEMRDQYAAALAWLGEYYWHGLQEPARAIGFYKQRLQLDAAHEPAHQALIRLYLETGQLAEARQQYHACQATLQSQLGVEPARSTENLLHLIISMEQEARGGGTAAATAAAWQGAEQPRRGAGPGASAPSHRKKLC